MGKITHEGVINLGSFTVPCYVLEDGTRVISGGGMQDALKMFDEDRQTSGSRLSRYLNQESLKPYLYNGKDPGHFDPLICYKGGQRINGYEATILLDICDGILEARRNITLFPRQAIIADQCEIIVRGLSRLGLIALIDEATGYQYERERDELQKIIDAYVAEELRVWQKTFPDIYYKEIFRLNKWEFTSSGIKNRPGVVGTWTNDFIYKELPEGVLEELKSKTPKSESGNYSARFHQSLTADIGAPHLTLQLNTVITLLRVSDTWEEFLSKFNKLRDRRMGQLELDLDVTDSDEGCDKE